MLYYCIDYHSILTRQAPECMDVIVMVYSFHWGENDMENRNAFGFLIQYDMEELAVSLKKAKKRLTVIMVFWYWQVCWASVSQLKRNI